MKLLLLGTLTFTVLGLVDGAKLRQGGERHPRNGPPPTPQALARVRAQQGNQPPAPRRDDGQPPRDGGEGRSFLPTPQQLAKARAQQGGNKPAPRRDGPSNFAQLKAKQNYDSFDWSDTYYEDHFGQDRDYYFDDNYATSQDYQYGYAAGVYDALYTDIFSDYEKSEAYSDDDEDYYSEYTYVDSKGHQVTYEDSNWDYDTWYESYYGYSVNEYYDQTYNYYDSNGHLVKYSDADFDWTAYSASIYYYYDKNGRKVSYGSNDFDWYAYYNYMGWSY